MIHKSLYKIIVLSLIVTLNWAGLSAIGETFAYFSDTENPGNNDFTAGILDMTVRSGQGNFVPGADNMTPGKQVNRDIYVGKTALSMPLNHNVSFDFVDGDIDLCNLLDLKIWYNHHFGPPGPGHPNRDMRLAYNGKLSALSNHNYSDFEIPHPDDQFDIDPSNGTEQWFYYSIILPSAVADSFQGEVCNFKFVFEAWQTNLPDSSSGFTDKEELGSTIKAGYWNPPVVLNEFLPNADNYPEFIEIYNRTALAVDLSGFYIKANGNIIPINATNTVLYSGGLTTISANGWLVITAGGDNIDDSFGTITLYNPNDVEVDSYTYGSPDHNVNNTPGWTNNLVAYLPFDNDFDDKSGNGNDGTSYGDATIVSSGKINQALSLDGDGDYISVANSDDFDFGAGEFSVEFWIKTNSSLRQWVGTRYENYGPGWGLGTQNSHALGYIRTAESGTSKTEIEGSVDVANNDWHHLVMVRTGDKIKLYTDGSFETEGTLAGNVNNDEPIEIGRISWSSGSQYLNGFIDEVKIYNRVLDATEILQHYSDVDSSGAVPVDKSYARIPDGSANWVDPIPTPGSPNRLSGGEIGGLGWQQELTEEPISEDVSEGTLIIEESPVNEEIVSTEEIVLADEEITTTTDETGEEATTTEEATITEATTTEATTTQEEITTTTDEIITTIDNTITTDNAITTDNVTTTGEATTTEEATTAEEATTTEEISIIEEINEIIDGVIDEIIGEIIPDELVNEEIPIEDTQVIDETATIEEVPTTEEPVIEEEPIREEAPVDEVDETPTDETYE